ncbi:UDP-glycosyltransferase 85A2 [Hordeum vulgare]|nr:UDP-glycosyltransferase 85A2 [Hordeum vulgare]
MGGSNVSSATISLDVESEDGRSTAAVVVAGDGSSRKLLERAYPQEVWRRGEPCLRLERSRVLLAQTPSMDELEACYRQFVLLASAVGDDQQVVMSGLS